jgi:flagellar export protein FliJ
VKAYRFRLDSVLRVRQLQERVAAQQLAVAARELHGARTELARARRSLDGLAAPTGRLTVGAVEWVHAQSSRMSDTARERADAVEAAQEVTRQATDVWGSARQRTTMLERLDERHVALWRVERDRVDAVELDDLTTGRTPGERRRR